ncbi:MAG: hypothetical protein IPK80_01055 [Nannocystis sp.]|nr:hypothetical protein [Nannocystis sp.]
MAAPRPRAPSERGRPATPPACALAWADLPAHARAPQPGDYDGTTDLSNGTCEKNHGPCSSTWPRTTRTRPCAYWNLRDLRTAVSAASSAITTTSSSTLIFPAPAACGASTSSTTPARPPPPRPSSQAPPRPAPLPVVAFDPDESTPPADTLREFVTWAARAYPSERLMVILWGHGQGWRPALIKPPRPCVTAPAASSAASPLTTAKAPCSTSPAFHSALAALPRPVDVLAADACLMQTVEVGLELQSVARYLVGYPQIAPYPGLPYSLLLPAFTAPALGASACPPLDDACQLAERIPAIYGRAVDAGHYALRALTTPSGAPT